MSAEKKQLSPAQYELTVTVPPEELQPFLQRAAESLSADSPIAGFRPGKAPYDVVKGKVGEMAIYQRAADNAISQSLLAALEQQLPNAEVVGQPQVSITQLVPGNPLVYTAIVTLLPEVTLPELNTIKVERKAAIASETEITKAIEYLRTSRAKESIKLDAIAKNDRAVVDFTVAIDNVMIEGGSATGYPLLVGENKFIPGFEDQLIGLSKGESRKFQLSFPENYHQNNLAGKLADFSVTVQEVYRRELPEFNDELAKSLGQDSAEALKTVITKNLTQEAEEKESQRQEIAMLDGMVAKATFNDIPKSLIDQESHRMVHELADNLEAQGLKFDDYLGHLKKTHDQLQIEFHDQAEQRVKTALVIQQVAKRDNITVPDADVEVESKRATEQYQGQPEILDNLKSASYRRYLVNSLRNRKVIEYLKAKILGEEKK